MSHKIIVLSDGVTWEAFDPKRVSILTISDEALERLEGGAEPDCLTADDEVESDATLQDIEDVLRAQLLLFPN